MKQKLEQVLASEQISDQDFLAKIFGALFKKDLSNIDLETMTGPHRAHSVLFDNYELNIARTPVFVHKNKIMQFIGIGEWLYQDWKYERYEMYIFENSKNVRAKDIIRHADNHASCLYNVIMQYGTMISDPKRFLSLKNNLSGSGKDLFCEQNSHLFSLTKNIYDVLDGEYMRRQQKIQTHNISDIKTPADLYTSRMRMIDAINTQKQK